MSHIEIIQIDPIWCKVRKQDIPLLKPCLNLKKEFWVQGPFRKQRKEYVQYLISKDGRFLSGFLPRVEQYCLKHNIQANSPSYTIPFYIEYDSIASELPKTLKEHQIEAFTQALKFTRGVIHHPTGSGKTEVILSILRAIRDPEAVIIVNTKTLLRQTHTRAKEYFPTRMLGYIGDGGCEPGQITIGTIQSLSKLESSRWHESLNTVIIDEAHHVSTFKGTYAKVLSIIPAPIRLGFTATLPYIEEAKMALEGYIGPVISKVKPADIPDMLVKPTVKLVRIPFNRSIYDLRKYPEVYQKGIVANRTRNKLIVEEIHNCKKDGRTNLVLVTKVSHGNILIGMLQKTYPQLKATFLWSVVEGNVREQIRTALDNKKLDTVIATAVWKEGVDIPSLGAIINAAGGESEIQTLQGIGRGLRKPPGKTDVLLIDFFDPSHHYLVKHFGHRLGLYFEEDWM